MERLLGLELAGLEARVLAEDRLAGEAGVGTEAVFRLGERMDEVEALEALERIGEE